MKRGFLEDEGKNLSGQVDAKSPQEDLESLVSLHVRPNLKWRFEGEEPAHR